LRFVDLSAPIAPSPAELPDALRTEVEYSAHAEGAQQIAALFGVGPELLRGGEGWATDYFTRLGTHNSTHVDAPWHYNSTIGGERAQTIDELPLIVLIRTGRDAFLDAPDYMIRGPGVTAEATHWLFDRGVRVMGIDAWGWDRPLNLQAAEAIEAGRPGIFWAAHQAGLPYAQIERLANLGQLPATGFTVACFPLRLVGGSAAPARVVAILDD
jgi:kynurenine formamidase